jgi:hypothetical protein
VQLSVRSQAGTRIATHTLSAVKSTTVIDPAHYEGLRADVPRTRTRVTTAFLERFPGYDWFLTELLAAHPPNGVAHLQAILRLADVYPPEALTAAFEAARPHQAYNHAFVRGVLEGGSAPVQRTPTTHLPLPTPATPVRADLRVYQALLQRAGA